MDQNQRANYMSNSFAHENEQEQDQEFEQLSAHHPSAPPDESFDVSTTVDPSYVISMIRRLLPSDAKDGERSARSGLVREETKTEARKEEANNLPENAEAEVMESSENYSTSDGTEPRNEDQNQGGSARQAIWEECGCVLWDLAASDDHAQFMVQNLILEVLLANLLGSRPSRITEISLGIIGNLACHEISRKQITSTNGLIEVILEQLFLDDVPSLCETCRVLALCLQGGEGVIWAEALKAEHILARVLWIAENALNPQLIEKSVDLLLAILESKPEVTDILLPPMSKLDLSSLLIKLFAFEMGKLREERTPERYSVLDLILRTIEALSAVNGYSQEMCQNEELLPLVKELIKFPDKSEIASTCISAAVLMANILTDSTDLASELSQDLTILQGLFDVLRFASDETEAQNAIWGIIARLLPLVRENEMTPSNFRFLVSILTSKLDLIEDELLTFPMGEYNTPDSCAGERDDRLIATTRISDILTRWKTSDDTIKHTPTMDDYYINEEDVGRLLNCCCKYSRQG